MEMPSHQVAKKAQLTLRQTASNGFSISKDWAVMR
jgi:hypothetical protein